MRSDSEPQAAGGAAETLLEARGMTLAYDGQVILRDLDFWVARGEIFVIMGMSGCGKSTLLRHLVGLQSPAAGTLRLKGEDFWAASDEKRRRMQQTMGVLFQGGALWSSMTVAENVALPLQEHTALTPAQIDEVVDYKLALVGLSGFGAYAPADLSGGMRRRAGLARAIALDPELLFFDEPSAGLDPINARQLDDLILALRDGLGTTVVLVTHELESILTVGDRGIFLDAGVRTILGTGAPRDLLAEPPDPKIGAFLTRGAL